EEKPHERDVEAADDAHRRPHDVASGSRHHEQNQNEGSVLLALVYERRRAGEDVRQEVAPVERWKRDQVEDAEAEIEQVDPSEHAQDGLGEKRRWIDATPKN